LKSKGGVGMQLKVLAIKKLFVDRGVLKISKTLYDAKTGTYRGCVKPLKRVSDMKRELRRIKK